MALGSIIEVAPIIGLPRSRDRYDYLVPTDMRAVPGDLVRMIFRNSKEYGIVLSNKKKSIFPKLRLALIQQVIPAGRLTKYQLQFAVWISQDNHTSLGQVLKSFIILPTVAQRAELPSCNTPQKAAAGRREPLTFFQYSTERERDQRLHKTLKVLLKGGRRFPVVIFPEISSLERAYAALPEPLKRSTEKIHGTLQRSVRFTVRQRLLRGEIGCLFGTTVALFEPLPNNKFIIIDDEQNQLYKQADRQPRYHILRLARYLIQAERTDALFMGVFPSVEAIEYIERCGGRWLRAVSKNNPQIERVSRTKDRTAQYGPFGHIVESEIQSALSQKKQVLLYSNRRTRSALISCADCGWRPACPTCQRPMALSNNKLLCLLCADPLNVPLVCPKCRNPKLLTQNNGVEFIAEHARNKFPDAKISILPEAAVVSAEAYLDSDLIIGTSRALRLPLPKNSLIIVLSLESELHRTEWWAKHYFIYTIRKLRSLSPALERIIVQQADVSDQDSVVLFSNDAAIIRQERLERTQYNFPPAVLLVKLTIEGDLESIAGSANRVRKNLAEAMEQRPFLKSVSPVYSGIEGAKKPRRHIVLKLAPETSPADRAELLQCVPTDWRIDVAPLSLD